MATAKQLFANRQNARKSTGPKTASGKSRSAANAKKHGLAAAINPGTPAFAEVKRLAAAFEGESTISAPVRQLAQDAAEAQFILNKVRMQKVMLLSELTGGVEDGDTRLGGTVQQLVRLDRYERRALSRRKSALRKLETLKTEMETV